MSLESNASLFSIMIKLSGGLPTGFDCLNLLHVRERRESTMLILSSHSLGPCMWLAAGGQQTAPATAQH